MHRDGDGGGMSNGADGEGLIDPRLFILSSTNHTSEEVFDAAQAMSRMGQRVFGRTVVMRNHWTRLARPGVYVTPQSDAVTGLMEPALDAASEFKEGADTAHSALLMFGVELAQVNADLKDLEERAAEFRDSVIDGVKDDSLLPILTRGLVKNEIVHWTENNDAVAKNKALLEEYAQILTKVSTAAVEAAKKVRAIDHMPWAPEPEPWDVDTLMTTQAPWGTPVDAKLDPLEQIGKGLWSTVTTTASGLWNLNPLSGGLLEHPWDRRSGSEATGATLASGSSARWVTSARPSTATVAPAVPTSCSRSCAGATTRSATGSRSSWRAAGPPCCRSPVAGCRCPPRRRSSAGRRSRGRSAPRARSPG